jgi:hypothetical protein
LAAPRPQVPDDVLLQLRAVCAALPESVEEAAWTGVRWRIRSHTFAHLLMIAAGWPPAYAAASGLAGPACVLTFRAGERLFQPDRFERPPFFRPPWFPNIIGLEVTPATDWPDVADLVRESYRLLAPHKLAGRLPANY